MIFKDILNREIVNLKNCDEEPIHVPGAIQPHGFLLAFDNESGTVNFCSGNVATFLNISYEQLLDKQLTAVFDDSFITEIKNSNKAYGENSPKTIVVTFGSNRFVVSVHRCGDNTIIEGEPIANTDNNGDNDLYSTSKRLLGYMEDSYTLRQLCAVVANAIKEITGYNRVMIYRFDSHYNGEVIAESKDEHLEAFLGLHYPHTDIPPQSRELYIKNQLRIIGDVSYEPSPIYTLNSASTNSSLDLSRSVLRSVSPIHLQYLQNMGVGATMTISLLHKGKLWGMVACHHYSPKYISHETRLAAKLQGHFITSQIDSRILNEEFEMTKAANRACEKLTAMQLDLENNPLGQIVHDENALLLCNASGISITVNNVIYKGGNTPADEDILKIATCLAEYATKNQFHTDELSQTCSDLAHIGKHFPGVNYMCLGPTDTYCIIWYRQEVQKEVNWAGDPNKTIEKNASGLSPRKSFLSWKEIIKGKSTPWLQYELNACYNFYNFIQGELRSIFLYQDKIKQKEINNILLEANAELENINWISTHDLQEPLRKIRIMSSVILDEDRILTQEQLFSSIKKMNNSAERMQTFIQDILKYTRVRADEIFEPVSLTEVIESVIETLRENIDERHVSITYRDLPTIMGIPFLLKQLFSNLVNNSLKFIDPSKDAVITITINTNPGNLANNVDLNDIYSIIYSDNGIGFNSEFSEKIFKVFSRLNSPNSYAGSGIGLALCRKIMVKHQGWISAKGKEGIGADFYLQFPKTMVDVVSAVS